MDTSARPTTRPTEPAEPAEPATQPQQARIDDLRDRLLRDAFLFQDPRGYRAGVEDALAGFAALLPSR